MPAKITGYNGSYIPPLGGGDFTGA